ncbi:hypothetical protein BDM02DRAFT_3086368 [Thelephora ganbajun]|uniref:Uncharacterized protein n=1 Tax=Thelephora ganbajun TaxID=370292 RepID=A0ACB6ZWG1_THEGA|nr:hypothetical protein BDM02DRAFT_3086368 [Thelephora ganbajun]
MSKKGSAKTPQEQPHYEYRDIILAKVRGYPPWPCMIVDPETVPDAVTKERPSGKKSTWYCVRFFPTGDYAWVVPKDMSKLKAHEIQSYINEPHKRSGDLLAGYKIALNPVEWEKEKAIEAAEAKEKAENAQVDELDDEDAQGDEDESEKKTTAKSRKRKREAEPAPKKTATKKTKESTEPSLKKRSAANGKGKRNGVKSKATVESEGDTHEEEAGPSKKSSPPPTKKAKREEREQFFLRVSHSLPEDPEVLKVKEWRHKLQKAFLNNKAEPKEEDMPACDELFKLLENYNEMTIVHLSQSKIGKVMRHIQNKENIPRDEEFKFRDRARALVEKWQQQIPASKANGTTKEDTTKDADAKGEDAMDVDATGEPATDKPDAPDTEDAVGDVSTFEGDLTVDAITA